MLGQLITPDARFIAYLPLAHIFEMTVEFTLLVSNSSLPRGFFLSLTPRRGFFRAPCFQYVGVGHSLSDSSSWTDCACPHPSLCRFGGRFQWASQTSRR